MDARIQNALAVVAVCCAVVMTTLVALRGRVPEEPNPLGGESVSNVGDIIASAPHSVGPDDAAITFVEFFDLQCPACRMLAFSMDSVISAKRHSIRIVRHHYPLTRIHPAAQDLALAGLCLGNTAAFEEYYHRVFEFQGLLGSDGTVGPLQLMPAGIDTSEVRVCMRDPVTWELLAQEVALAESLRLRATPSFIVHGRLYFGTRSVAQLDTILRAGVRR